MPDEIARDLKEEQRRYQNRKILLLSIFFAVAVLLFFLSLVVGSSSLTFGESFLAIFGQGTDKAVRIVQNIRLPRAIAAAVAGAGLSIAGLMMQTTLKNPMASPSTLGVSNAAVFGANLSIIAFAGGFFSTGNHADQFFVSPNPFATSSIAFLFAVGSTLLILGLCRIRSFSPETVVLAGIALGAVWTALTTLLQFFATDVGISSAVVWTFGDLGRATFETDWIMFACVAVGAIGFFVLRWRFNALSADENVAKSLGVRVGVLRFVSLLTASLITAVCVSYLGIIGFIGIICPHAMRRILGSDHRYLIPGSLISGSILLMFADIISTLVGRGTALPVGAVTAILGGPFFLYLIFAKKGGKA